MEDEWKIADKIQQLYCELVIIKNEYKPFTLYRMNDISKYLKYKSIRTITQHYTVDDKILVKVKTKGGQQNISFLTYSGLCRLLCKSRQPIPHDIMDCCGIHVNMCKYNCIEHDTITCITTAFAGENFILQYVVLSYRIDLYFPKYRIAVECDECQHFTIHNNNSDRIREADIITQLDCKFIRYNPYDNDFNIFYVINQIYKQIKEL
jgi:very-short-patch-repair endonuclease